MASTFWPPPRAIWPFAARRRDARQHQEVRDRLRYALYIRFDGGELARNLFERSDSDDSTYDQNFGAVIVGAAATGQFTATWTGQII